MDLEPKRKMLVRAREVLVRDVEGHSFARVRPALQGHGPHLLKEIPRSGSGGNSSISTGSF